MNVYLKLILFVFLATGWKVSAQELRDVRVNVKFDRASMLEVLNTLKRQTALNFVYNHEEIKDIPSVSADFKSSTVKAVLDYCLKNTSYTYTWVNDVVVIKKRLSAVATELKFIVVTGEVTDEEGNPLPGASVLLKGTTLGVATDEKGKFRLEVPDQENLQLVISFIGMEQQVIKVEKGKELKVKMQLTGNELDDVVVTGYFTRSKNAFTGSITTVKGEDLIKASPTNFLQALSTLTPGLRIMPNYEQGSNPNAVPDIIIRGTNSLTTEDQVGVNAPLIMLDGVEITLEELYDIDMYDIDRVQVLKDASATVLYGEKASNGVILIERTRVKESKPRLSYNFVPNASFPDLTSLRLCNAEQKLELERLAGLYRTADGSLDPAYAYKLQNVRRGIDTDWAAKPLRWAFTHSHSLNFTGRGNGIEYKASARFSDKYGVMKGDYRRSYGLNFSLGYHVTNKITLQYIFSYSMTDSKDTPYGKFSLYTALNPYNPVYDEEGEYIRNYYFNPVLQEGFRQSNPLYDATLSSFNKSRNSSIKNSLIFRGNITKSFYVTGQFNLNLTDQKNRIYRSPESSEFASESRPEKRGTYRYTSGEGTAWDGKLVLNYRQPLNETETTVFTVNAGADINKNVSSRVITSAEGFLKDQMTDIKFASQYSTDRPNGGDSESAGVGFFVNGSFELLGRYFIDGSYKTSGSSKFGKNNRFTPVWSGGIGWNLHKENFMAYDWLDILRLHFSVGYTANIAFSPYQAMTTYNYSSKLIYYTGIGAVPITMGNPDLKWQRTMIYDWGLTATLFDNRLNLEGSYWKKNTSDVLMPIDLPWSVGVSDVKVNMAKMYNAGYDFAVSGQIIRKPEMQWMVSVKGEHFFDKLRNISDALKATNAAAYYGAKPQPMYEEGGSQYAIYGMRSAGIDPATGKEIYIKKNGQYTFDYDIDERVEIGNTNPLLTGSIFTSFYYKGFTLNLSMSYTFGGDIYNTTLADKVENIDPHVNVDRRAFTERWKAPGDVVRFLGIPEKLEDQHRFTERFVERQNELAFSSISLNYEFKTEKLKKIGIKRLNIGFSMEDLGRISSVKFERGTEYPFERRFGLSLRPTF